MIPQQIESIPEGWPEGLRLRVMTWLWRQTPNRHNYGPEHVNAWAKGIRRHLTLPHDLCVVTDQPEGIDNSIEIIHLKDAVPAHLLSVKCANWRESTGAPQCYRRLALFAPDAAKRFGGELLISMDLDVVITGSLDDLFDPRYDFRMYAGTSKRRPYNGSLVQIRAGARASVYTDFTAEGAAKARAMYIGSDQAWISYKLGAGERTWGRADGIYHYGPSLARTKDYPSNMRMLFFPGFNKPWEMARSDSALYQTWKEGAPLTRSTASAAHRKLFWAYDDKKGWGRGFMAAARARGETCRLFGTPAQVRAGTYAFIPHSRKLRTLVLQLSQSGVESLPSYADVTLTGDLASQVEALGEFMPRTILTWSRQDAGASVASLRYPVINRGTGAPINNAAEAQKDIAHSFRAGGQGFICWQRAVSGVRYRAVAIGGLIGGLAEGAFADPALDPDCCVLELAQRVVHKIGIRWAEIEIILAGTRAFALSIAPLHSLKEIAGMPLYGRDLAVTKWTGTDALSLAVDLLKGHAHER